MSLLSELRRRNVHRMAALYAAAAWLVMQVIDVVEGKLPLPDWMGSAVLVVLAVGFPIALVISWFYEVTPEGISRDTDEEPAESTTGFTGRRVDFVIIAVLAAALIVYVSVRPPIPADVPIGPPNSVAVLPFVNMSSNPDNEHFSDGLTDTLLHMLAQVEEIQVVARTSSFAFKGEGKDIRDIALALGVAHVLEGSVQRSGDRVRITAQLIRADDGFHLWSESYDRTLSDIFAIQDEIAMKVGGSLAARLLEGKSDILLRSIATKDIEAYDLYLQARLESIKFSFSGLKNAESLLKAALNKDPDFLDAKAELARNLWDQVINSMRSFVETSDEILALTSQVLKADARHPLARIMQLGAEFEQRELTGDYSTWPDIRQQMQSIVDEVPGNNQVTLQLAWYLKYVGEVDEALLLLQAALKNDPLNPQIHFGMARSYMRVGQWDKAHASILKSIELEPGSPNAYIVLGDIEANAGNGVGMIKNYVKSMAVDPEDHGYASIVAENLYYIGLPQYGDQFRSRVAAVAPLSVDARGLDMIRARSMGDRDKTIELARRMVEDLAIDFWTPWAVTAVHIVLQDAVERSKVEETIVFLDEHMSGFSDLENLGVPAPVQIIRMRSLAALRATTTDNELHDYVNRAIAHYSSLEFKLESIPNMHISVLLFRGETEVAIEVALSGILSKPVAWIATWRYEFSRPDYADIVADPRVQKELQRLDEEEAAYREEVRAFLDEQGF